MEVLPPPSEVSIPLKQHHGVILEPLVSVGDRVLMGQKIGDSTGVCAPVHASVSGKVTAILESEDCNGTIVPSIVISNDGEDRLAEGVAPFDAWESFTPEELRSLIREGGIVGMGGLGFPTHLKAAMPGIYLVIINAAESDPYLTSDIHLLTDRPHQVFEGIRCLMRCLPVEHAIIGA
ncbi:MAG: hypothetical protein FWE76_00890, partial [Symbiobacteriaceae bacterium]|nr:hypothetical protein [Symbiobacteriaceae bacterium]